SSLPPKLLSCSHVPLVPCSLSFPKKDRHNRAASSSSATYPLNRLRAPFARRPCRSSSAHSARRRDLPGSPAAAPSGLRQYLPACYRSRPPSPPRSSPWECPQPSPRRQPLHTMLV